MKRSPLRCRNEWLFLGKHVWIDPLPVHRQGFCQSRFPGEELPDLSETEAAAVLSLPVYPELSHDQAEFIARTVKAFRSRSQ